MRFHSSVSMGQLLDFRAVGDTDWLILLRMIEYQWVRFRVIFVIKIFSALYLSNWIDNTSR